MFPGRFYPMLVRFWVESSSNLINLLSNCFNVVARGKFSLCVLIWIRVGEELKTKFCLQFEQLLDNPQSFSI